MPDAANALIHEAAREETSTARRLEIADELDALGLKLSRIRYAIDSCAWTLRSPRRDPPRRGRWALLPVRNQDTLQPRV